MSGYNKVTVAVNVMISVAFVLFCFVVIFYIHNIIKKTDQYLRATETLQETLRAKGISANFNVLFSTSKPNERDDVNMSRYDNSQEHSDGNYYTNLRESFLEQI